MGIAQNLIDKLASSTLSDWTAVNGGATRAGSTITSSGNTLWYTRSSPSPDDRNFLFEAVLKADNLLVDEERGARMWVAFRDAAMMPGEVYWLEVRLYCEGGVSDKIKLWNVHTDAAVATLTLGWSGSPIRVRIKRQTVSGTDYVLLQAEDAGSWENPHQNNILNDPGKSMAVPVATLTTGPGSSELGFGHKVAGAYTSDWESVHITTCTDKATALPYWPPALPSLTTTKPAFVYGSSDPVEVQTDVDASGAYFSNDVALARLTGTVDGVKDSGTQAIGSVVTCHVKQLSTTQAQDVSCQGVIREVSGREAVGTAGPTLQIPDFSVSNAPVIQSPLANSYINTAQPTISGDSDPYAEVEVFANGISLGTTIADDTGNWTFPIPGPGLADAIYDFTAQATNPANIVSAVSATVVDVMILTATPDGEVLITDNLAWFPTFDKNDWSTPAGTKNQPINVCVRVSEATYQVLDFDYSTNPVGTPPPDRPSKLMVKVPGAAGFDDKYIDSGAAFDPSRPYFFNEYSVGSPTTDRYFVLMDRATAKPMVFQLDGVHELQVYLVDFATNNVTVPAAPAQVNLQIPPTGNVVVKLGSAPYASFSPPVTNPSALFGIESPDQLDFGASWIKITDTGSGTNVQSALLASTGSGPTLQYLYEAANPASFPGGVTVDADGDYSVEAHLVDLAGNVYDIPVQVFLVDTKAPAGVVVVSPTGLDNTFLPLASPYIPGTWYVALAVPTATVNGDLDEPNSTFNVYLAGAPGPSLRLNDATINRRTNGSDTCFVWPSTIAVAGTYTIDYELKDKPAGNTQGPQTATLVVGKPSFSIDASGLLLSHFANDGSQLDAQGEICNGTSSINYMGVHINNSGNVQGDCWYRLIVIPKCLFTQVSEWKLVNYGDAPPLVQNIPAGGGADSDNNVNYQEGSHPYFPPSGSLFPSGAAVGTHVHTCTAGILHSSADPLVMVDATGNPVTITDDQFKFQAQFESAVMNAMLTYNGGNYWTAVSQNPKIANRNFSFKKVV